LDPHAVAGKSMVEAAIDGGDILIVNPALVLTSSRRRKRGTVTSG
jgi:hypothetical protein